MKRGASKLIGMALIISSCLLQVGYAAAATGLINGGNTTEQYGVAIEAKDVKTGLIGWETDEEAPDVTASVYEDTTIKGAVRFDVENMYPGTYVRMNSVIHNIGRERVKITGVEAQYIEEENYVGDKGNKTYSKAFYEALVGVDENKRQVPINQYNNYLKTFIAKEYLEPGESFEMPISFGFDIKNTGLQDQMTAFRVSVTFEQDSSPTSSETPTSSPRDDDDDKKKEDEPEPVPQSSSNPSNTSESNDNEEIEDEPVPQGPSDSSNDSVPNDDVEIEDEPIPQGLSSRLPKTGTIAGGILVVLGIIFIGIGKKIKND